MSPSGGNAGWIVFAILVFSTLALFVKKNRERGAGASAIVAGSIALASGLVTVGLAAAHLVVVLIVAFRRSPLAYDFRLYSLLLLGVALAGFGLMLTLAAPGVARDDGSRTRIARNSALMLLLVNVPLAPLQGFAVLLAALAGVTLVAVLVRARTIA